MSIDQKYLKLPPPPRENIPEKSNTNDGTQELVAERGHTQNNLEFTRVPPAPGVERHKPYDHAEAFPVGSLFDRFSIANMGNFINGHKRLLSGLVGIIAVVGVSYELGKTSPRSETTVPNALNPIDSGEAQDQATTLEDSIPTSPITEETDNQAETEMPDLSIETVDGTVIETTDYPDDWEGELQKRTRVYTSPYTYTEEVSFADGTTTTDYKESSHAPLADVGLDHPIYEAVTGTSWEEFVEIAKTMTPEISGEAYDAEDVVEGYYQRGAAAVTAMDPRFIEITYAPDTLDSRLAHTALREAFAGERSLDRPSHVVILERLTRKKTDDGEVFTNTTDFNVSMSTEFTAEYLLSSTYTGANTPPEEHVSIPMETTFVRNGTMLGEVFLVEE